MRTTVSVLSLLAMSLGTSALATTQLGGTIGIDTTGLTTAEIAQLKTAVENGDEARISFILDNDATTTPDVAATPGRVQMAEAMGVSPEEYTLAELTALMLEDISPVEAATSPSTTAKEQLALSLGVDPADYSVAELVALKFD